MSDIDHIAGRPGLGARLTNMMLKALRPRTPIDMRDPAALVAARDRLDGVDARMARLRRKAALPYTDRDAAIGGVPASMLTVRDPVAPVSDDLLLFVHGGGFFFRSIHAHRLLAARIARAAGIEQVVLPLYRLAPEHVHPAARDDILTVYRALLAGGADAARIVIVADSAGGALALGAMIRARDAGLPLPRAIALLSPMTDLSYSGASIAANATRDPMFGGLPMSPPLYHCGDTDPADPDCSPLFANLAGLPPLLVQVGSSERLRDDSVRLAVAADRIRVEVWPEMPHVFQAYDFREARQARGRIAAFLRGTDSLSTKD
jgi:acetyl esterase/lipase